MTDMVTAWSAVKGMTVFMSMKVASSGRASRMEPNPDNPCVKPARKVTKLRRMYVLDNDASEKCVPIMMAFPLKVKERKGLKLF
jgi:hypothetical protein